MAFLTWFGGAGFILRTYYGVWQLVALVVAAVVGLAGAALVFLFLSKVLHASERVLDPNDYYLPGTLARVTSSIRAGGTGEIVYTKGDTRQVAGARSVDSRQVIEKGTEVVIMRYERGLAYVQRWDDLMRAEEGSGESSTPAGR
jgi:membrane protein implicated in regulation of membrane protease activity